MCDHNCGNGMVFEDTLHYTSPAHGGWGVVRMGHLMPESYQLFVSPAACGRHGAVSACMQGRKNRVSYLYLGEDDIVSGGYEELLLEAVDELLQHLERTGRLPRVLMIFVSCIDDLLGTDHEALLVELRSRHPQIRFSFCHMNPTSMDTQVPPPVNIRNKLYELLDVAGERDGGVNLLGSLVPLLPDSEMFTLLPQMGAAPIRHIADYQSFDDFQMMARSRLNLVLAPPGEYAARQFQKKHGTPFQISHTTYDIEQVSRAYQELAHLLNAVCPNLDGYVSACEAAMEETRAALHGMPVVVDGEAVSCPFELARTLLRHGFHVPYLVVQQVIPADREAYEWIRAHKPQIRIVQPQHHRAAIWRDWLPDCLAVGYNSAYLTGSSHVVALDGQSGHWGYYGILDLLRQMRQAAAETQDLRTLIEAAGLVV